MPIDIALAQTVAVAMTPSVVYAISGVIDATKNGEQIRWGEFLKTLATAAVTGGFISNATGDMIVQISGTTAITYVLDKLFNAVFRKQIKVPM